MVVIRHNPTYWLLMTKCWRTCITRIVAKQRNFNCRTFSLTDATKYSIISAVRWHLNSSGQNRPLNCLK